MTVDEKARRHATILAVRRQRLSAPRAAFAAAIIAALAPSMPGQTSSVPKTCAGLICKPQREACLSGFRSARAASQLACSDQACRISTRKRFRKEARRCQSTSRDCASCCRQTETDSCAVAVCGDGQLVGREQCDLTKDDACPGHCDTSTCQCSAPPTSSVTTSSTSSTFTAQSTTTSTAPQQRGDPSGTWIFSGDLERTSCDNWSEEAIEVGGMIGVALPPLTHIGEFPTTIRYVPYLDRPCARPGFGCCLAYDPTTDLERCCGDAFVGTIGPEALPVKGGFECTVKGVSAITHFRAYTDDPSHGGPENPSVCRRFPARGGAPGDEVYCCASWEINGHAAIQCTDRYNVCRQTGGFEQGDSSLFLSFACVHTTGRSGELPPSCWARWAGKVARSVSQ